MTRAKVNIPIDEILKVVGAWSEDIVKAVSSELVKETKSTAKTAFKDKTGTLRKSIKNKKSRFDKDGRVVGAFAPHAHLVEYGHDVKLSKDGDVVGHAAAHPFLTPATNAVKGRLPEIIKKVVGNLTIKVGS